jgi:hypothetical protein
LIHKAKTEEPKTERSSSNPVWPVGLTVLTVGTDLTVEEHRSDRCTMTESRDFEAEDTRRDRKDCVEAMQVAVAGHLSDGAMTKISDFALEGHVSLIS